MDNFQNMFYKSIDPAIKDVDREPRLIGDDDPACDVDLKSCVRGNVNVGVRERCAWLKLSGVRPEVNDEQGSDVQEIVLAIDAKCKHLFKSIAISWSEEWNPTLFINQAKTCIRSTELIAAFEGLKSLQARTDAIQTIVDIVVKRIRNLFE